MSPYTVSSTQSQPFRLCILGRICLENFKTWYREDGWYLIIISGTEITVSCIWWVLLVTNPAASCTDAVTIILFKFRGHNMNDYSGNLAPR